METKLFCYGWQTSAQGNCQNCFEAEDCNYWLERGDCKPLLPQTPKVYNGTPHDINIVINAKFNPQIRKYQSGEIVTTFKSDGILSAEFEEKLTSYYPCKIYENTITSVDALPDNFSMYIVSVMYATACQKLGIDTSNLYVINGLVVAEDGKTPVGCIGLQKFN